MKMAERNRKRIYRVIAGPGVFSQHTKYHAAMASERLAEKCAARGILALTPETLIYIERWSATHGTWERVSA